jgi:hypothetical protein
MSLIVIECGQIDAQTGERVYKRYVEFFNEEVEIFQPAGNNTEGILLFRPSDVARILDCQESRVGMTLARKADQIEGVYRALEFQCKAPRVIGLKKMSYFLSLEACQEMERLMKRRGEKMFKDHKSSKRMVRKILIEQKKKKADQTVGLSGDEESSIKSSDIQDSTSSVAEFHLQQAALDQSTFLYPDNNFPNPQFNNFQRYPAAEAYSTTWQQYYQRHPVQPQYVQQTPDLWIHPNQAAQVHHFPVVAQHHHQYPQYPTFHHQNMPVYYPNQWN